MAFLSPKNWKISWKKTFSISASNNHEDQESKANNKPKETPVASTQIPSPTPQTRTPSKTTLPPIQSNRLPSRNESSCPVCGKPQNEEEKLSHLRECLTNTVQRNETHRIKPRSSTVNHLIPPPQSHQIRRNQSSIQPPTQRFTTRHLEIESSSPFTVKCPYLFCGTQMEAAEFYVHAFVEHSEDRNQNLLCPICALMEEEPLHQPRRGLNLLQHLRTRHSEFAPYLADQLNAKKTQTEKSQEVAPVDSNSEEEFQLPKQIVGRHYLVDTMTKTTSGVECTICFEEFEHGESIARMECFCIYHKHCIESWFRKCSTCPVHRGL